MSKLVVNQKLWFVGCGNYAKRQGFVTVNSVGRKWAEISGKIRGRIDVNTLVVDGQGYGALGQCYSSKEDWLTEARPAHAWRSLVRNLPESCPPGVTLETIEAAAKLLGVELEPFIAGDAE